MCDEIPVVLGESLPEELDHISYRWNTGETEASILVSQRGWYWVDIEFGCAIYRDSVFVEKPPFFAEVDAGPDQEILQGLSVNLQGAADAPGDYELSWTSQPGTAFSCDDCLEPSVSPLDSTLFTLSLTDEYGCQVQDKAWVYVDKRRDIFIPNVFSPNNDGINDIFFISGTSIAEIRMFQVFDRWGRKAFSSLRVPINSREYGWDGRLNGQIVSSGVYYYAAELVFPDQTTRIYKGSITLLR
jgi:gliding motility-associated-like protein